MELLALLKVGGVPILILGMLIYLVRMNDKLTALKESVDDIKKDITWGDTCVQKHKEVDRRLSALEKKVFNGGRREGD